MSPISNSNCSLLAFGSLISSGAGFTVTTFLVAGKETTITYYQFKINLKYRGSSRQRPLAGKGEDKVEPNAKFTKFLLKFTSVVPFPLRAFKFEEVLHKQFATRVGIWSRSLDSLFLIRFFFLDQYFEFSIFLRWIISPLVVIYIFFSGSYHH